MDVNNNTIFRGWLAHQVSLARRRAKLIGCVVSHPDNKGKAYTPSKESTEINQEWEQLRTDIKKVLDFQLPPYHALADPEADPLRWEAQHIMDPLRLNMRQLKARSDKARLKDPSITLLKSWDLKAKEPLY
jgi:hypothetical protein